MVPSLVDSRGGEQTPSGSEKRMAGAVTDGENNAVVLLSQLPVVVAAEDGAQLDHILGWDKTMSWIELVDDRLGAKGPSRSPPRTI